MKTGIQYADEAKKIKYDSLKYSDYDCQAFCELVLKNLGMRMANGAVYNWRGSNDMWRNAVSWRGTIAECKKKFGTVPIGAWVFMVKNDGGEVARGYHDTMGNASHIGIYIGNNITRDSTKGPGRDGPGSRPLTDWTHVGLCKMLDFNNTTHNIIEIDSEDLNTVINSLESILTKLKGWK